MKVTLDNIEIEEGYICKYIDSWAKITGVIQFGEWIQDGSGGEYGGEPCYGFYVKVIDIEPLPWVDDTKEETIEYYPDYLKNVSLLYLIRDRGINDLAIIKREILNEKI